MTKMYSISSNILGVDCPYHISSAYEEEVVDRMTKHLKRTEHADDHKELLADLGAEERIPEFIRSKMEISDYESPHSA